MWSRSIPAGLILCSLALGVGRPLAAQEKDSKTPANWSKVSNNSGRTYVIVNTDLTSKTSIGNLYCRKPGDKGPGKKVAQKGDTYVMGPGDHEWYFDTTGGQFAIHFQLQDEKDSSRNIYLHVTTTDPRCPGTEIQIGGKPLEDTGVIVDTTGYRKKAGGVLFTFTK
jgi:hypothetical protein